MMQMTASTRVSTWNRKSLPILALVTLALLVMLPATAAACGNQQGQILNLTSPWMNSVPSFSVAAAGSARSETTIVGLWHATYTTSDNQLFQESFDTWHKDGTELETANVNPIWGNVCIGVWSQVGSEIHLHHVGWAFDTLGNLVGPFTLDDVLTLGNRGNSYSGRFDFKQYDAGGNLLQEVTGTISATRIGVN